MPESNLITNERVRILYENTFSSNIAILASVPIMAYLFWTELPSSAIYGWISFMAIVVIIRHRLLLKYNQLKENCNNHQSFEDRYIWICTILGCGWAFIIVWGLTLPDFVNRMYSILLLSAIVAASVPIFSSSLKTMYLYLIPSVGLSTPILLIRGGSDTALGLALIIFTCMMLRSGRIVYSTIIESLEFRFQTQQQAKKLEQLHIDKVESEQRMQHILDYTPTAIYVKDLKGRYTLLNKKVGELHKIDVEESLGKTIFDIFPAKAAAEIHKNDLEVIEKQQVIEYLESTPLEDGMHHFISIKFPLFDDHGKIYALGGIATDITDRVRAEESLKISQQHLLMQREQSPFGVIEWNTDFEFINWNPAAQHIFGYSTGDVLGKHITQKILPESAREAVNKIWHDLLENKGGRHSINENLTKDGRTILCEWHNTPLIDHNGKVIGVTSLVEDITNQKQSEDNLRHIQKMDAIGKLTGGIAHDFNNMLAVILGFSELIEKCTSRKNEKIDKYNHQIFKAAERAKSLTSKLLDFSRKTPSFEERADLNQLLNDARHMLEKTLTPRIKLILELNEALWSVWIDTARLEDTILNISINAMHAMSNDGKLTMHTNNVHLSESDIKNMDIASGDYVSLSFTDTGIGMEQHIQQKIFDPFFTTKDTQGTGLGLSQVYGFVKQSKGGITVSSTLGEGTQFTIYLPRYNRSDTDRKDPPHKPRIIS